MYAAYREAGGNFVDTANMYTEGVSEQIVGHLIRDERDSIVLATKFTLPTNANDVNSGGSHRKSLRRSVETSLRRLETNYLDLLWVHAWDQLTPMEETLRALDDLVSAGKILAIGVSNTPAWVVARSDAIAELRGWSAFCAVQVEYSLSARTADRELLPMARSLGLAATAWSPLAGGLLSGKFSPDDAVQQGMTGRAHQGRLSPPQQRAMDVVGQVAGELDTTPARVALSWVLRHGLIPVIGARTLDQLHDIWAQPRSGWTTGNWRRSIWPPMWKWVTRTSFSPNAAQRCCLLRLTIPGRHHPHPHDHPSERPSGLIRRPPAAGPASPLR
jgi:aryl-alcohol dehydrogenase-like predicted oxidoreductase